MSTPFVPGPSIICAGNGPKYRFLSFVLGMGQSIDIGYLFINARDVSTPFVLGQSIICARDGESIIYARDGVGFKLACGAHSDNASAM